MKREHFLITSTEGHNAVKYAWNSARKEVQRMVQNWVNLEAEKDALHVLRFVLESESEKDARGRHVSGVMRYKEMETGREVSFFITKIA